MTKKLINLRNYQICMRCVMDTSDPEIIFNDDGICNHCINAIEVLKKSPQGLSSVEKDEALNNLIKQVKKQGEGKKYDCVIGISGGIDSSYLAFLVRQWGLRPIVVHYDNHWDSEIAKQNVDNICRILGFEKKEIVVDWEEFKDLQLSFLKASTPDSEVPSDNGIFAALIDTARKYNIKYILSGQNISSESILAKSWSQGTYDETYIKTVQRKFGKIKKISLRILSSWDITKNIRFHGIKIIRTLYYVDYNREQAKALVANELEWKDYGRKHGESTYTRIFQEYILPVKFGIDKRRAHYSSLIVAGQMTRDDAIKKLSEPLYTDESIQYDIDILCNKFDITRDDFQKIMNFPVKSINDYNTNEKTLRYKLIGMVRYFLRPFRKIEI